MYITTLVLPSVGFCFSFSCFHLHVGEITQGSFLIILTLVLPPMKPKLCILTIYAFWWFWAFPLIGAPGDDVIYHRWSGTLYIYIYSLGHFLTTKGALIDGDGYPPKMPKNDPKNHSKFTKIWSKLMSKNDKKQWFLMVKSSFWSKSPKCD